MYLIGKNMSINHERSRPIFDLSQQTSTVLNFSNSVAKLAFDFSTYLILSLLAVVQL